MKRAYNLQQSGFTHLLLILFIVGVGVLTYASVSKISGSPVFVKNVLLAKGADDSRSVDSGSSVNVESSVNSSGSRKVESKSKVEIEAKGQGGERVEIKREIKNGEVVKEEIRKGNVRVRLEMENGDLKIRVKGENNEVENEVEDENEAEIENEIENELGDIKIATSAGKLVIKSRGVEARTNFPLSIDLATKQLIVTTPAGTKVVAILPDKAVENLLRVGIVAIVNSQPIDVVASGSAGVKNELGLEMEDGVLSYKIEGTKFKKFLGFIPFEDRVTAFVSAEDGRIQKIEESFWGRILGRLSS